MLLHTCKYNSFQYNSTLYSSSLANNICKLLNPKFSNILDSKRLSDYTLFSTPISTNLLVFTLDYISRNYFLSQIKYEKNDIT